MAGQEQVEEREQERDKKQVEEEQVYAGATCKHSSDFRTVKHMHKINSFIYTSIKQTSGYTCTDSEIEREGEMERWRHSEREKDDNMMTGMGKKA